MKTFTPLVIDESFRIPVVVDFWAPWCDPCLMLEPILTELAQENEGRWKLEKINIDEREELAKHYYIMGVPAIRIFYKGEIIASYNGLMWKKDFERWINEQLAQIE